MNSLPVSLFPTVSERGQSLFFYPPCVLQLGSSRHFIIIHSISRVLGVAIDRVCFACRAEQLFANIYSKETVGTVVLCIQPVPANHPSVVAGLCLLNWVNLDGNKCRSLCCRRCPNWIKVSSFACSSDRQLEIRSEWVPWPPPRRLKCKLILIKVGATPRVQ